MTETISGTDSSGNPEAGLPEAPDPAWVEGAPLRLLAYALHPMPNRTGKVAEIKAVLQSQVEPSLKLSQWWKPTYEMVAQSDHFKIGSRPTTITLLSEEINDIPSPPLPPPPPTKAQREWLQWFLGEADTIPSKSGNPAKAAHDALNICPAESLGTALQRTIRAAGDFLSRKPTKSAAESWADLLSNAEQRWRSRPGASADDDAGTVARVAELTAYLAAVPESSEEREWWQWFQGKGETDAVPPNDNPVKAAYDALNVCPPKFLGTALQRTIRAAGDFLSREPTKSAAESWADLLSNAEHRWRSRPGASADDNAGTVARVAELTAYLAAVPESSEEREWWQWFQGKGEADAVPPNDNPVKAAYDALNVCPPKFLGTALQRTVRAAGDFLSREPTESAAKEWAHLLSNAAQRWRSSPDADSDPKTAAKVAGLMVELLTVANFTGEPRHWLCQAGALLDDHSETWRRSFAAVLWDALPPSGREIRNWFDNKAFTHMMRENQVAVAREIALAAFAGSASPVPLARFPGVDALLSYLSDAEKAAFLRNLVTLGISGKAHRQSVVDYIAHAHSASHPQRHLDAAVPAAILLADGDGPVADRAAQGIAQALDDDAGATSPVWEALLSESRRRIASQHAVLTDQIEELRAAREREILGYENRIAQSDRETARLRAEIAAGREESRLDIRQDMLTVISETLYDLRARRDSPEELLRLVATRLSLALRAGGAEEFGTIGETVPYDPIQYHSDSEIPPGSPVRIAAPGAVVRGKLTGDRVLVKASVVSLTEDESCR